MGNLLPLDSSKKQQIEDIAEEFLREFTLAYNTEYGIEYTKNLLKEIDAESFAEEKPVYLLLHRSPDSFKDPLKMGYLTKKGAIVKNWKKRYFVVNPDYSVDYFENEEAYGKGFKPKGTIFPCGYEVFANMDETMMERIKNLAKLLGVDENEIGGMEKLPEHTFEVGHSRRRSYLITAETEDEKVDWVETFKVCCRKADGLKSDDPVGRAAFKTAIWKTYWRHRIGGTEEQVLSDILVDRINYRVMTSVYTEIKGGWTIKQKVKEQVVKTLDSLVMAMVIPSWKAMQESSQQMKGVLETAIKDKKDELIAAQRKVMWDLSELLKTSMEKVMSDMVDMIKEIVGLLKPKMEQGLVELKNIFIKNVNKIIEEAKNNNEIESALKSYFKKLDYVPRSGLYDAVNCTAHASDLRKYDERIKRLNEYVVVDVARDKLAEFIDSAVYTFEERFKELVPSTDGMTNGQTAATLMEQAREEVLMKYDEDQNIVMDEYLLEALMCMLVPHTHSLTDEVCKPLITSVEQSIPTPLKQAISLGDKYDTYVETCIRDTLKKLCGIGKAPVNRPSGKSVESKKESETAKAKETVNSVAEEKASEEPAKAEEKTSEGLAKSEEKTSEELAKSEENTSEELAKTEEKTSEELAESEEKPSQESKAEEKSSEEPKAEDNPIEAPKVEDNASEEKKPENPESGKDGEKESTEL
ncbi:PREDICTED: PH domain-containing protein DDB_G0267786-like isoform X2 [Acropora digitifera]|uniref:PH domain-containing protein DDB_G0267786-like isoform X2 n=1 Tax=Acropora digitifera TaxID=70779 RepID=UPI00077B25EC|nr:PREDICTED: PH domain-containing protein DDB_G0267786-like isoform X2 [Acropora digitifera]